MKRKAFFKTLCSAVLSVTLLAAGLSSIPAGAAVRSVSIGAVQTSAAKIGGLSFKATGGGDFIAGVNEAVISFTPGSAGTASVAVQNSAGKTVYTAIANCKAGTAVSLKWDGSGAAVSGSYANYRVTVTLGGKSVSSSYLRLYRKNTKADAALYQMKKVETEQKHGYTEKTATAEKFKTNAKGQIVSSSGKVVETERYSKHTFRYKNQFRYDAKGRLIRITYTENNETEVVKLSYNAKGQVASLTVTEDDGDVTQYKYSYDARGNVVKKQEKELYDDDVEYTTHKYTYNKSGNIVKDVVTEDDDRYTITYTYDAAGNRLTAKKVEGNEVVTYRFGYDPYGNLISIKEKDGNETTTTVFVYTYQVK